MQIYIHTDIHMYYLLVSHGFSICLFFIFIIIIILERELFKGHIRLSYNYICFFSLIFLFLFLNFNVFFKIIFLYVIPLTCYYAFKLI